MTLHIYKPEKVKGKPVTNASPIANLFIQIILYNYIIYTHIVLICTVIYTPYNYMYIY